MVVCIEPALGLFFRINTKRWGNPPVPLSVVNHIWLDHDSYLECGEPLSLDDYMVEQSIEEKGIIGTIDAALAETICASVKNATTITAADKTAIRAALKQPN
jgi:hypothetical protein